MRVGVRVRMYAGKATIAGEINLYNEIPQLLGEICAEPKVQVPVSVQYKCG